jgi:hypothetical protein
MTSFKEFGRNRSCPNSGTIPVVETRHSAGFCPEFWQVDCRRLVASVTVVPLEPSSVSNIRDVTRDGRRPGETMLPPQYFKARFSSGLIDIARHC